MMTFQLRNEYPPTNFLLTGAAANTWLPAVSRRQPAMAVLPSGATNNPQLRQRRRPTYFPARIPDPNYVRILDTTLRDGEQSPGVSLSVQEKLDIARQLALLGVDVIEVGYPMAGQDEREAAQLISREVGRRIANDTDDVINDGDSSYVPVIQAFARCKKEDLDTAWQSVRLASRPRVLTFVATSDIHLQHKLRISREEAVRLAVESVSYLKSLGCDDITFGAEDAGRSEPRMLCHIFEEVIKAGATTIVMGDTVGSMLPHEISNMISNVKANTIGVENAVIGVHCHDDLGLATANTLAAIAAGARQVDVTVNGIGERAGNAALEEVVMAIKSRGEEALNGIYTGINTLPILDTSNMVVDFTNMNVQPHKAIVGANAFLHESGIHQDGVLKYRGTYEFLSPEDIGLNRDNQGLILGKHSGRSGFKMTLKKLGYDIQGETLNKAFLEYKMLAKHKKVITSEDLEKLVHTIHK